MTKQLSLFVEKFNKQTTSITETYVKAGNITSSLGFKFKLRIAIFSASVQFPTPIPNLHSQ